MTTHGAVVSRSIRIRLALAVGTLAGLGLPSATAQTCTGCSSASFAQPARLVPVGVNGKAAAAADLDGDGDTDLVVATTDGLSVLLGDGAGGFAAETRFLPGIVLNAVAIGDVDGDGRRDVVVGANRAQVSVLHGDGSGGFALQESFGVDYGANRVALGDLSGDGQTDLVVGTDIDVAVRLGDGVGGFGPIVRYADGSNPADVLVADVTGDGLPDVILAERNGAGTADVWILKSQPGGALVLIGRVTAGTDPRSLTVGDFDRDGVPDLAVALYGASGPGAVALLHGTGNGFFAPAGSLAVAGTARSVVAGDWNGDGRPDLAAGCGAIISILDGDGQGGFAPFRNVPAVEAVALVAGDWDADGRADLAAANEGPLARVASVYAGDGHGGFGPTAYSLGSAPLSMGVGDFNRDGKPDLATTHYDTASVSVLLGDGLGGFGPAASVPTVLYPYWLAVGDLNADGADDLVVASLSSTGISVLLSDGSGGFQTTATLAIPSSGGLDLGDFNGDGRLDLAVSRPGADTILVLPGNGAGGFGPSPAIAATDPGYVEAVDLNADGKLDLVSSPDPPGYDPSFVIEVFLGNGNGTFAPALSLPLGMPSFTTTVEARDLNGDGFVDLAVQNNLVISLFLGTGGGQFGPVHHVTSGLEEKGLAVADFNGDGRPDLVVGGLYGLMLLAGDGSGAFGPPQPWGSQFVGRLLSADFDQDGRPDLAALSPYSHHVVTYRNTNCVPRRLRLVTDVSGCSAPGAAFSQQPVVDVTDDAGQRVSCASGLVTAAILPGTGSPGAALGGLTSVPLATGRAIFTDLRVDAPGRGYRLELSRDAFLRVRTRAFSQGLAPGIAGPALVAPNTPVSYDAGASYESYVWRLDGSVVAHTRTFAFSFPALGSHTLEVVVTENGCAGQAVLPVKVVPLLGASESTVAEGDSGPSLVSVVVSLSAASSEEVVVGYATEDGGATAPDDYASAAGSLTFAPGVTSRTLDLVVSGDTMDEPNEAFAVRLSGPVNALLGHGPGRVVILDDDGAPAAGLPSELSHGSQRLADLASLGGQPRTDWYVLRQSPRASYEIVTDSSSGDLAPLDLVRIAADGATVAQSSVPVGTGPSRSLRWQNTTGIEEAGERIRIRSGGCGSDCGADDVYRVRAYETTCRISRFNNAGGLRSVILVHNPTSDTVEATLSFWAVDGTLLATHATSLPARSQLKLESADIPALAGQAGSVTVANDAPFGTLSGKAAIVDAAGRFSFDSPLVPRTP